MANIQAALTLVAPTGTGIDYSPWDLRGPRAEYRNDTGALKRTLTLNRTDAAPTKGYEGALKTSTKTQLPVAHPVTGVLWPQVMTVNLSLPDFLTPAQKLAFVVEQLVLYQNAVVKDFMATGNVPQS